MRGNLIAYFRHDKCCVPYAQCFVSGAYTTPKPTCNPLPSRDKRGDAVSRTTRGVAAWTTGTGNSVSTRPRVACHFPRQRGKTTRTAPQRRFRPADRAINRNLARSIELLIVDFHLLKVQASASDIQTSDAADQHQPIVHCISLLEHRHCMLSIKHTTQECMQLMVRSAHTHGTVKISNC